MNDVIKSKKKALKTRSIAVTEVAKIDMIYANHFINEHKKAWINIQAFKVCT
jgi:hypothetical protein